MPKKFISYPSTGQFSNTIKSIKHDASYVGQDDNGEPIYDVSLNSPVVEFTGTVKGHGSNTGICFNNVDGFWVQSRNNIITPEKDNASCAFTVESNRDAWIDLIRKVSKRESIDLDTNTIVINGEWSGKGIQKGVAISQVDKFMMIFAVKVAPFDEELSNYWVDPSSLSDHEHRIYNAFDDFETYKMDIDFGNPKISQNKLIAITEEVEKCCPIGKFFGVEGIGEGVVWTSTFNNKRYAFKVKGTKHSKSSKVKQLAPVDTQKLESIRQFVEFSCDEGRLSQGIEMVFTQNNEEPTIKQMGSFIRWVVNDITKECMDNMRESGLEPKECNKEISNVARKWFMGYLDKQVFGED